MDKKKKLFAAHFSVNFFLLLIFLIILAKPAQAQIFGGRFTRLFNHRRSYQASVKSYSYSYSESKSSERGQTERGRASNTNTARLQHTQNQRTDSRSSGGSNLTPDEQKALKSRHQYYDEILPGWGGKRENLDPDKAAQAASAAAKDLGKEGRQAYALTMKEDVARYKENQWVAAIDAFDPKTGAVLKLRRARENGHYVFNVYDQATGLWLHNLKGEDKNIIALSPAGIKIKVAYGDPDHPKWASIGYYPTNLKELNIFAGYNRGDDHLIRAIRPVAESPSDLGQQPAQPITHTLEELMAYATRRDSYSGLLVRPELAALAETGALSEASKLKIAKAIVEDTPHYGRLSSISERIKTINKSDGLEGGGQREYAVYGARNYQGRSVYFGFELSSSLLTAEQKLFNELGQDKLNK